MTVISKFETFSKSRGDSDRLKRIVEAARRAFVRHGFHAATMHHVAEEAAMSAGNLYRYFASKEALVEGLCLYDHDERAENFRALASGGNLVEALIEVLREHVLNAPREKARMILEIWAEAARNPRVAEITQSFDADTLEALCALFNAAKLEDAALAKVDVHFAAQTMITLVAGVFKRLAVEENFDRKREASYAIAVLRGLFSGAIAPETEAFRQETK